MQLHGSRTKQRENSAHVETCLTHARRGQHTHSKQKLLYLSNIKTYVITRMLCNNTSNLSQQSWQNSQVNTVYSSERLDDNNTQPQPSSCLWWSQSVCVILTSTPPLLPSVWSYFSQQLGGNRRETDRTDLLSLLKTKAVATTLRSLIKICWSRGIQPKVAATSFLLCLFLFYKSSLSVISFTNNVATDL